MALKSLTTLENDVLTEPLNDVITMFYRLHGKHQFDSQKGIDVNTLYSSFVRCLNLKSLECNGDIKTLSSICPYRKKSY